MILNALISLSSLI